MTSFFVPSELKSGLEKVAQEKGISLGCILRNLIQDFLERPELTERPELRGIKPARFNNKRQVLS